MSGFKPIPNENSLTIHDLGLAAYRSVLAQQQALQEQRKAEAIGDTVLIVEHLPVITLGARAADNKLLASEDQLAKLGIDLVPVRRGGGGTAHNPGQLVFYPIINLKLRNWGIGEYIAALETIGITFLAALGITATQVQGKRGLWVGPRKIASIGVRISRSVTHHGMAINIQNDLQIFKHLIPCGLDGVEITSAHKETGRQFDMDELKRTLATILYEQLNPAQPTNNQYSIDNIQS